MKALLKTLFAIVMVVTTFSCGGDDQSRAERDAEIQKKMEEAVQKEGQLYQGMRKGVEEMEKKVLEDQGKQSP
jgi:outer membrane lipopolysaccharide assembly protein LptE/RlpB